MTAEFIIRYRAVWEALMATANAEDQVAGQRIELGLFATTRVRK